MGNVLGLTNPSSSIGIGETLSTTTASNDLNLWDMVLHLFKRYVISKVENDEFLCAYLLNTDHKLTFLRMGQRAITYEPLPSRVKYYNNEKYVSPIRNVERSVHPRIEEYKEYEEKGYSYEYPETEEYTESSEDSLSEDEDEDEDEEEDKNDYLVSAVKDKDKEGVMGIYAIYSKLSRNTV